jgi:hypothetical protein
MSSNTRRRAYLYGSVAPIMFGAIALANTAASAAPVCQGAGAPTNTQTKCLTAITIPGAPLNSFDISWVDPDRGQYFLGDRSNSGVDIINTRTLTFVTTVTGFVGFTGNNNTSGPDGVTSHGRWVYAGDGNSTLKVIDLDHAGGPTLVQSVSTGAVPATRVDEMALTTDGKLLVAANNANDPPFATLFKANGDNSTTNVMALAKLTVDPTIIPAGDGLSLEQPTWNPNTKRFYVSVPQIAGNPTGCSPGANCDGGMLVIDPLNLPPGGVFGAYDPVSNTGMVSLHACSPNGITLGLHNNLLEGCTPGNNPSNVTSLVINAKTLNTAHVDFITGSDEVWFNSGDNRYYLGASKDCTTPGGPCATAALQTPHLGVVSSASILIEKIPSSANSHSVAADSKRNLIFLPEAALNGNGTPNAIAAGVCGTSGTGCVAVYKHDVDDHDHDGDDHDHDGDDHDHDHDH